MSEVRVAVVTGGLGGLGQVVSRLLAERGFIVYATDIRPPEQPIEQPGVTFWQQDVAQEADWVALSSHIESTHGALHVLVNNAAILMAYHIEDQPADEFDLLTQVNLKSVFLGTKHMLPLLVASGQGSIINMSSSSALVGFPHFAAYGATKAAVRNLTMSTAIHCVEQDYPVRCNSVHPDGILTPMIANVRGKMAPLPEHVGPKMAKYACQPEDVADVIVFLCSNASRHMNGAELRVDGGATVQSPYS